MRSSRPCQSRSTAIASRVMPASGPVSSRSSPSSRLISVDLPVLGRPTTAMRIGFSAAAAGVAASASSSVGGRFGQRRAQRIVESGQPLAVLGADRDRVAETQRIGFKNAGLAGTPFALVGDDDRRLARFAHQIGKGAIGRSRAGARIDEKEHGVGLRQGSGRLRLDLRRKAFAIAIGLSSPAVSMTLNDRSPSLPSPSRRSRVTPGRSSTSARRAPTRRLNRVDLPTLGRPTMATVKDMVVNDPARSDCRPTSTRGSSAPYAAVYPGAISVNRWCRVSTDSARAVAPAAPSVGLAPSVAEAATPSPARAVPLVAQAPAKPAGRLAPQTVPEPDSKPDRWHRKPAAAEQRAHARPQVSVWASALA